MGVHLTFVRSVDLDEWTQSQIDSMRLGGNGNARSYFRKHGFTDLYGGKTEKKYKSKAAVSYKAELKKLVQAEAAKRGEGIAEASEADKTTNILANLELADQKGQEAEAKAKLAAARAASGKPAGILAPKAKPAASMPGASKLSVPSGGMLRKPKSSSSSSAGARLFKKKPTGGGSKLRVNKLSMNLPSNGSTTSTDDFEDIETTQKAVADAEKEAKKEEEEKAKVAADTNDSVVQATNDPAPAEVPEPTPEPPVEKKAEPEGTTMEQKMAKLKAMNGDFFSQL